MILNQPFVVNATISFVEITVVISALHRFEDRFSGYRRWLMGAWASLIGLNIFAKYFPTPFTPWSWIAASLIMTLLLIDIFGYAPFDSGVAFVQSKLKRSGEPGVSDERSGDNRVKQQRNFGSFRQYLKSGWFWPQPDGSSTGLERQRDREFSNDSASDRGIARVERDRLGAG